MGLMEHPRGAWSGEINRRDVVIKEPDGTIAFKQEGVEAPAAWSDRAIEQPARLYFRTFNGKREDSVIAMVDRVVTAIGDATQYPDVGLPLFDKSSTAGLQSLAAFRENLRAILLDQRAAFNTPVWINVGAVNNPQASACFIQSVEDTMASLTSLQRSETELFRNGSGTGTDFSGVRPKDSPLSGGGTASGPVPFVRAFDGWAGVTKSGGKARRAAKMISLKVTHPDIAEFIASKRDAQKMIRALVAAGWDPDFNGQACSWIPYQNANHSVRVSDAFMRAVQHDSVIELSFGDVRHNSVPARQIWAAILDAAWECGDPGLQFDDTINRWHTSPHAGRINASNPCCITGDTQVDTSEGKIEIAKLEQMSAAGEALPFAFAFDNDEKLPVLRRIKKVWVAGETSDLVEVRTDKGVVLRCTPDHRFLLRDGRYVEAGALAPGDRLRKIGRAVNHNRSGRRQLYHRIVPGARGPIDTVWQNRFMWEQAYGPIPEGMEVHHINGDATDDRLSNFELRSSSDHRVEHSVGEENPRYIDADVSLLVETWEAIERLSRITHKGAEALVTPGRWNKYVYDHNLDGVVPKARWSVDGGRIRGMSWSAFSVWIEEHRGAVNDRVLSVTRLRLDSPVRVYDMEVEGVHNFAVGSTLHTIVIHNSEYMFLDDSACNLASLNLVKYYDPRTGFAAARFYADARTMFIAMEALVSHAGYPTEKIAQNSHDFRPLGLGYANLGAMLMRAGLPYDSNAGRAAAAAVTSLLGACAYRTSAEIAQECGGAYPRYDADGMGRVLRMHEQEAHALASLPPFDGGAYGLKTWAGVASCAAEMWSATSSIAKEHGVRNAQATLLAPTGTIGFMMDCDTTGIEPDTALVRRKNLAAGGQLRLVNRSVGPALQSLGYAPGGVEAILAHLEREETLEGAPHLKSEHRAVFQCALGDNPLRPEAHVLMCAAVQPFLSGAISKTVNVLSSATPEDIGAMYTLAWEKGMKAISVYRDGCKGSQPLEVKTSTPAKPIAETRPIADVIAEISAQVPATPSPMRRRMPVEARTERRKFTLEDQDFYFHVGLFEDGTPGELFIRAAKQGSFTSAALDQFATTFSLALQYGVPLVKLLDKMRGTKCEPRGWTGDPEFPNATSVFDALAQWMEKRFIQAPAKIIGHAQDATGAYTIPVTQDIDGKVRPVKLDTLSGRPCRRGCGPMLQDGTCWRCPSCGDNTGGCGG